MDFSLQDTFQRGIESKHGLIDGLLEDYEMMEDSDNEIKSEIASSYQPKMSALRVTETIEHEAE